MGFANAAIAMLDNQGPVTMKVPGLCSIDIAQACEGLKRFDRLSRDEQARWMLHEPRDPKYDEPDDGAIRKEPPHDWKLYFHYRRDLEALLHARRGIALTWGQRKWFRQMERIWKACTCALHGYARELDRLAPGYDFEQRALQWEHLNVLRLLRYVPHAGTLAKWHTDRDAITFHIAESAQGLRSTRGWEVVEQKTPQAPEVLVFAGDQLDQITHGAIQRCHHAVEDTTGGTRERFAMVFFGKFYPGTL